MTKEQRLVTKQLWKWSRTIEGEQAHRRFPTEQDDDAVR